MLWFLVFFGIALVGVVFLAFYVRWLVHKATDVFSELDMLRSRLSELSDLLGQLGTSEATVAVTSPAAEKVSLR